MITDLSIDRSVTIRVFRGAYTHPGSPTSTCRLLRDGFNLSGEFYLELQVDAACWSPLNRILFRRVLNTPVSHRNFGWVSFTALGESFGLPTIILSYT